MKYQILKMSFPGAVHFGDGGLATCTTVLCADTVFSALCCEAARNGENMVEQLVADVKGGKLIISDALPFIRDRYYIPKPLLERSGDHESDPSVAKLYKKLNYLPINRLDDYLAGTLDVTEETNYFHDHYGKSFLLQKARVSGLENSEPYAVGLFRFSEGSGLYICVGYEEDEIFFRLLEIFEPLQYSGIGGKVSSGYGQFRIRIGNCIPDFEERFSSNRREKKMTLSICLPKDDELEQSLDGARYLLVKRSGFVASFRYADTFRKKQDCFLMRAGSVFCHEFQGDVFDASAGGSHPVYRYAKPFFLEVI
jgi:CRISPR-associated protein Csm4